MSSNYPKLFGCGLAVLLALATTTSAGSLAGRTRIELGAGVNSRSHHVTSHIGWDGVDVSNSTGAIGRLAVSHWQDNNVAYVLSYTVHDVESATWTEYWGETARETSVVHSLMFGLRYYFPQSRRHSVMRPYFAAEVGPFFGTQEYEVNDACDCEVYSEVDNMTVMGARLGGGVDLLAGHHFAIGFNAGYNFVDEFPEPINGRVDYSGADFGFSFSVLFGRGGRH